VPRQLVVEMSVTCETLPDKKGVLQVVEGFMQDTASQLTYYGLVQLHQDVREGELCVFFRNNHFCTMKRHKDELYLLVTDVGYYEQEKIVWEKLADVSGDNAFCDATFSVYHPSRTIRPVATVSLESVQNALSDFASGVGITASAPPSAQVGVGGQASAGAPARSAAEQEDADMALALSLQSKFEEEERRRQQQAQLQSQQQARGGVTGAPVRGGASSAASRQIASSGTAGDQMTNYRLSQQVLLTSPSSDCAGTCCMCSALKPPELCRNGTCSKAVDRRVNLVGWCKVLHKRGQCKARRQGLHKGGQRRVSMADLPKRTRVAFCSRT